MADGGTRARRSPRRRPRVAPGLRYVLSVALLAVAALTSFSVLAGQEGGLREDSHRVNVTGRQRMLSQQVVLQATLAGGSGSGSRAAAEQVAVIVARMRSEHEALVAGSAQLGLSSAPPTSGAQDLDRRLVAFWAAARRSVDPTAPAPVRTRALASIQREAAVEGPLLERLERQVTLADASASEHLRHLHRLIVLAALALLLLGAAVLVPLGRALRRERARLLSAHDEISGLHRFTEAVLESVHVGVVACDAAGRVVFRNGAQRALRGPAATSADGRTAPAELALVDVDGGAVAPEDTPLQLALRGVDLTEVPMRLLAPDGRSHELLVGGAQIRAADGSVLGAVASFSDITAERAVQDQLRESVAFHDAVLSATPDVVYVLELAGATNVWSSRNLHDLLGYTEQDLAEMGSSLVARLVHPEDLPELTRSTRAAAMLADRQVESTRYRTRHKDGSWRVMSRRVTPFRRGGDGEVVQLLGIARDITEVAELEAQLRAAALHDSLTGLPNRVLLLDRLSTALRRNTRTGAPVAVLFCDLDGFKGVNDTGGHATGDRLLVTVADRLAAALRPSDTVARVGGDEFVVVLDPGPDAGGVQSWTGVEQQALVVATRLTTLLAEPVEVDGACYLVTASIGMSLAPPGSDPEAALREADAAMYTAKRHGKNRVERA